MKVYWEDELIKDTKHKDDKLIFVKNLKLFITNSDIEFDDVYVIEKGEFYAYAKKDNTEWRQVKGIESKEDLINTFEFCGFRSYKSIKFNLERCAWKWASSFKDSRGKSFFSVSDKDCCYYDEELFLGLNSTYKSGYFFNNTDSGKVYENVYMFDISSCYTSILLSKEFPCEYKRIEADSSLPKNFFGQFIIKLKERKDFINNLGRLTDDNLLAGYFNNIDFDFINRLCGIESFITLKLWEVKTKRLRDSYIYGLEQIYKLKESSTGFQRRMAKAALERMYGESLKSRFYSIETTWNSDSRTVNKKATNFNFKEMREKGLRHRIDFSIGIWTCSYARLRLLMLEQAMGEDALYGDIDSIKFCGEKNLKVIEKFNKDVQYKDLNIGQMKNEGFYKKFKVLKQKWYIAIDENEELMVKCSGANTQIVSDYLKTLKNPIEAFSTEFPEEIKPYKKLIKNEQGKLEYIWISSEPETKNEKIFKILNEAR